MRARSTAAALALLIAFAVHSPAGAATRSATATAAKVIRTLNAERRANGIPAGIRDVAAWNQDCKRHDTYMARSHTLTHDESPANPWYTAGGTWAGQNSVLEYGTTWANRDPYEFAPIHLAQLLQPRLNKTGAFELSSAGTTWGCTVTIGGFKRADPKTNRVYTYPGNGRRGVNYVYVANELPKTPNQALGIPARTGQQLFVFASGPILGANPYAVDITKASLHPAGGSNVHVRIADALLPFLGIHLGNYLGPGAGIVIPVKPLRPSTRYVASVTMKANGMSVSRTWSFTTKKKSS